MKLRAKFVHFILFFISYNFSCVWGSCNPWQEELCGVLLQLHDLTSARVCFSQKLCSNCSTETCNILIFLHLEKSFLKGTLLRIRQEKGTQSIRYILAMSLQRLYFHLTELCTYKDNIPVSLNFVHTKIIFQSHWTLYLQRLYFSLTELCIYKDYISFWLLQSMLLKINGSLKVGIY